MQIYIKIFFYQNINIKKVRRGGSMDCRTQEIAADEKSEKQNQVRLMYYYVLR